MQLTLLDNGDREDDLSCTGHGFLEVKGVWQKLDPHRFAIDLSSESP